VVLRAAHDDRVDEDARQPDVAGGDRMALRHPLDLDHHEAA
jgi:hypothetical protein